MTLADQPEETPDPGNGLAVSAFLDDTDDLEGARFVRNAAPGGWDEALVMEGDE